MKFYSTQNPAHKVSLSDAVTQGLAPDNGLYMPEVIPAFEPSFFDTLEQRSFEDIGFAVAQKLLGADVPEVELRRMVAHTIDFDAPAVTIEEGVYALELFHGPTLAFKDFGARFMSQLLGYFARQEHREITILVATSGDTGSAVANGFLGVAGTRVVVLYPSGKVSEIQEKQFTTLGQNITALEVEGTFDDCQAMVKQAFMDTDLRERLFLTSANSINIARLIPQSFYYFYAWAQLKHLQQPVVFSVPSGNFGNLTGGLLAARMGLPIAQFLACTNVNDVVPEYLHTQVFTPRPSRQTMSNAMDVGNPSNFARMLDLYGHTFDTLTKDITGYAFTDDETREAMRAVKRTQNYVLDPHGAVGYLGLKRYQAKHPGCAGVFLETAHPGKFAGVVGETLGETLTLPQRLQDFMASEKKSVPMAANYQALKEFLTEVH